MNIDINNLTAAQIAFLLNDPAAKAKVDRVNKLKESVKIELETLAVLESKAKDFKNLADENRTGNGSIWQNVASIVFSLAENPDVPKDEREQSFTDVMGQFLMPGAGPDGKPLKLSTVGQYASTGRKMLTKLVTEQGMGRDKLEQLARPDVMKLFKSGEEKQLSDLSDKIGQQLRFIIKHSPNKLQDVQAIAEFVEAYYNPIKSAKDSEAAAKGKQVAHDAAQHPTAPTVVETVAATVIETIGDADNTEQAQVA